MTAFDGGREDWDRGTDLRRGLAHLAVARTITERAIAGVIVAVFVALGWAALVATP